MPWNYIIIYPEEFNVVAPSLAHQKILRPPWEALHAAHAAAAARHGSCVATRPMKTPTATVPPNYLAVFILTGVFATLTHI